MLCRDVALALPANSSVSPNGAVQFQGVASGSDVLSSPGEALWLIWEMADATGKAQGLAIDNLTFSATAQATLTSGPCDFLRSGEKDIHAFADNRRTRRPRSGTNDATTIKSTAAKAGTDSGG